MTRLCPFPVLQPVSSAPEPTRLSPVVGAVEPQYFSPRRVTKALSHGGVSHIRLDWPSSEPEFSKDATWDGYLAVISGVAGRALEAQLGARTLWATSPNQGHHRRSQRDELEAAREARPAWRNRARRSGPYCVMRRLSDEALGSGRILAARAPQNSEVHGLSALM